MDISKLFRLNLKDLGKGLVIAILAVVLHSLGEMVSGHGFDFMSYDWAGTLDLAWKAAGVYLSKNLLTNEEGKFAGIVKL